MEARAYYGPAPVRPSLTVVKDGAASYSALPHAVLFSGLSDGAIRLYAVMQSHWRQDSECFASHATLALETGKKERTIRALLAELEDKGYIVARHHGRGQGKAYRPADEAQSGRNLPVGDTPKRQKSAIQAAEICHPKRQKSAAPIEEETGKKNKKKKERTHVRSPRAPSAQSKVIDLIVAGGAPSPTFGGRAGKAVREAGDPETVAAAYLAVWRGEWGAGWLRDNLSIHAVVDRLDGFRAWRSEQEPAVPHLNGTVAGMTPATDEDRAIWAGALDFLAGVVNAVNLDTYLRPLEVAGRLPDGGLCLIVPSGVPAEGVSRFRDGIRRALMDAGDPKPMAVAFKARRSKEPTHAG